MASIVPSTAFLLACKRQNLPWKIRMGELIDNAFDARATSLSFAFGPKTLTVRDNGDGCSDPLVMIQLGGREQQPGATLGRYGVGVKDAAISTADRIQIETVHRGVLRKIQCDWRAVEKSGRWEVPDPQAFPSAERGTQITLLGMFSDPPDDRLKVVEELSLMYTPAIRQGRQITITWTPKAKPTPVPEFVFPTLEHDRTKEFDVSGRRVKVRMGVIPKGHSTRLSGLILAHNYRVIKVGAKKGLSDHPIPALFGWADLLAGWELSKNKDNITENESALMFSIREAFADVIALAERQSLDRRFAGIGNRVTAAIDRLLTERRKAKRGRRSNPTGAAEPTGGGSPHRRAGRTQPGARFPARAEPVTEVRVAFAPMGEDGPASKFGDDYSLTINTDILFLRAVQNNPDAITLYAAQVAAAALVSNNSPLMPDREDVEQMCGNLLRHIDATPTLHAADAG